MADDAASVLAPNAGPVLQLDPSVIQQSDPLASYSPPQPEPAPATATPSTGTPAPDAAAAPTAPQPDPEVAAGAAHQNALLGIAHKVASLIGGDITHRVVKDPDGTYSVHMDESTDKERWGRIAAAVLGGAAHGLAAGQGPGGGARAVAAGFDTGQKQQQQISDQATAESKAKNDNLTAKANHAMQDQQLISLTYGNKNQYIKDAREQATWDLQLQNMGAEMIANPKNVKELAQFNAANPNLMNGHLGTDGSVLIPDPQADGSVRIWRVPPDQAKMKVPIDVTYDEKYLDDNGSVQTRQQVIPAHSRTGAEIASILKGNTLAANNTIKTGLDLKNTQKETNIKDAEEKLKEKQAPVEEALKKAQTGQAWSEANVNNAKADVIKNTLQQRPGGEPTEVEDPRFPPPNNFPVGTIGIAPAPKGAAVPPTAAEAYRLKNIMQGAGDQIRQTVTANPQVLGRLQGLVSKGKTIAGLANNKDDLALASLAGSIQQYAQASAGFHKFRNKSAPAETEQSSLNNFRNAPQAVIAYLDSQKPALAETDNLIKNYEVYHTPNGPSEEAREAAARRAPNGARFYPNPVGTPTPAPGGQGGTPNPPPAQIPQRPPNATPQAAYVQTSDGKHFWIEPDKMAAAKQRDPKLQVLGQ
jgi:hypothetical protein